MADQPITPGQLPITIPPPPPSAIAPTPIGPVGGDQIAPIPGRKLWSLPASDWYTFLQRNSGIPLPVVGVDAYNGAVIVVGSCNYDAGHTDGTIYVYDMVRKNWAKGNRFVGYMGASGDRITNFVLVDGLLTFVSYDNSSHDIAVRTWDSTPDTSISGYITFRDDDFDVAHKMKKVYSVTVTYKCDNASVNYNTFCTYAKDGSTTFVNTSVPSVLLNSTTNWDVAQIVFTTPIECQSFRLKLVWSSCKIEINDVAIKYRVLSREVT